MSDDIVIRAEGLGKKYVIGHEAERERYVALRDVLVRTGRNAWRKTADLLRGRDIVAGDTVEEFWALKDVSFEVKRGEVLGIIGRNGAGKSTLLKILSRITEPSEGRVTIRGRVASLLEVGTGFHPELTGRENIYLNGAILGMTRAEIRRKFDEIVAFAEVEKFLDTPVKRYSSGMYVRLAFAVAAHLEPEILVVDEVLAVGDAAFQDKCLGKMRDVSEQGRTVIFVSHNMGVIETLTGRSILLRSGSIVTDAATPEAIAAYLTDTRSSGTVNLKTWRERRGTGPQRLNLVETRDTNGRPCRTFRPGEEVIIHFELVSPQSNLWDLAFALEQSNMNPLFASHLSDSERVLSRTGEFSFDVSLIPNFLRQGHYLISTGIYDPSVNLCADEILHYPLFEIAGAAPGFPNDRRWGPLYFPLKWRNSTPSHQPPIEQNEMSIAAK